MMRAPTVRGFQRTPSAGIFRRAAGFSPLRLPNLAAWYDLGPTRQVGTTSDDIRIDASNRVSLLADRSGNSPVNVLCLNGAAGNSASLADSVPLSITGDIDIQARLAMDDWTPALVRDVVGKWVTTGNQRSFVFQIDSTGVLVWNWSTTGADAPFFVSSVAPTVSDLAGLWVRVTMDVDNGSGQHEVKFWTGGNSDTPNWVQLGTTRTGAGTTSIFNSTAPLHIGARETGSSGNIAARIYRTRIYADLTQTDLRLDANFALAGKLVSSFTESSTNAATVTINSSGDLGARICGERDLVQLTASKQPIYTAATATTPAFITFDGSDDYMKAAAFSLSQPETVYFVGQQVSWTNQDRIFDGGSVNTGALLQNSSSPRVDWGADSPKQATTGWALQTTACAGMTINGASSTFRLNRGTATNDNIGAGSMNGFTLGANGSNTGWANQRTNEVAIYAAAHDTATVDRWALYASAKWRISGV